MAEFGHLQTFGEPNQMSAPPPKAGISNRGGMSANDLKADVGVPT
jgi:hypothetical protein